MKGCEYEQDRMAAFLQDWDFARQNASTRAGFCSWIRKHVREFTTSAKLTASPTSLRPISTGSQEIVLNAEKACKHDACSGEHRGRGELCKARPGQGSPTTSGWERAS